MRFRRSNESVCTRPVIMPPKDYEKKLNELRQKDKNKLLVIELDDIDSVPTVYYKGEKVGPKTKVDFKWQSKTSHSPDSIDIEIEHVDTDSTGVLNTIKKRKGWGEHR